MQKLKKSPGRFATSDGTWGSMGLRWLFLPQLVELLLAGGAQMRLGLEPVLQGLALRAAFMFPNQVSKPSNLTLVEIR